MTDIGVRLAGPEDIAKVAALRAQWTGAISDPEFERRVRDWLVAEADTRGYARLVLSPTQRAVPFYRRAGFVDADEAAGNDRMMVRVAP
jgi:hypothetical protein